MENDIRRRLEDKQYNEAFELLLEQFKGKVFRLVYSMLRNESEAEDMTQDIFLKIWRALPGYHGGASLSTWIYVITRNTCLTELKRRYKHPTVSLQETEIEAAADGIPALHSSNPEPGLETDVEMLVAKLPERYQQVITLFYLEQKAYHEVAEMLGIPIGTVKTLLFRAKKELLRISARQERTVQAGVGLSRGMPNRRPIAPTIGNPPKSQQLPVL